jgi:hypothetical protein
LHHFTKRYDDKKDGNAFETLELSLIVKYCGRGKKCIMKPFLVIFFSNGDEEF